MAQLMIVSSFPPAPSSSLLTMAAKARARKPPNPRHPRHPRHPRSPNPRRKPRARRNPPSPKNPRSPSQSGLGKCGCANAGSVGLGFCTTKCIYANLYGVCVCAFIYVYFFIYMYVCLFLLACLFIFIYL